MLPWYSVGSAQMANNLIKWWRTKFLNGYKQFSVNSTDCGDGRMSDTEELLGQHCGGSTYDFGGGAKESSLPSCSTPPPGATSSMPEPQQAPNADKRHLNLEEFSCDVSMEGGIDQDGQERQEFSFTLYDFDGHGKITKDDIAGLVTTIYETLGSSVKVPHYGSKTIKVKLTVSPDQRKHMSATVIDHKKPESKNTTKQPESERVYMKKDLNVTIKDSNKQQKEQCSRKHKTTLHEESFCCNFTCRDNNEGLDISDGEVDCTDHCSRVSYDDMTEDEGDCSEDEIPKHPSCEKMKPRRYQKHTSPRYHLHSTTSSQNAHVSISPVLCTKARRSKKRSSSLQRQELLEIIQANMDKNNLSFQTTGKQCPNHIANNLQQSPPAEQKHRHRHKTQESSVQLQCLANMMNSNNYYVDLSALQENNQSKIGQSAHMNLPYCRYDKLLGAVVCMSNKHVSTGLFQRSPVTHSNCRSRKHYRSKSHDLTQTPFRYHLLEAQNNISAKQSNHLTNGIIESPKSLKKTHARSKSYEAEFEQTPATYKKNVKKFPQVVLGHSSSPHHLKHRNRQEDQARAMAQVVRWLEQEFSSNVNVKSKSESKHNKSKSRTSSGNKSTPTHETASPTLSGVERHEHHHVHEHIHHHYHHYQETPVVV